MENKKLIVSFMVFLLLLVSMYIVLDKRITNLENENIMLRDTLNEKNSFIWLNQASQFNMEE